MIIVTSSFPKSSVFKMSSVHTKTQSRCFQIPPSSETQGLLAGTMRYFRASDIVGLKFTSRAGGAPALEANFRPTISHRPGW